MSENYVTCEKELGSWTIRINGKFVADFWSEKKALKVAMGIYKALR